MKETPVFLLEGGKTKYESNHKKLSLLPTLSTILMGIVVFLLVFYYFIFVWGVQIAGSENMTPDLLIKNLPKDIIKEPILENTKTELTETNNPKSDNKIILTNQQSTCSLIKSSKPKNLKTPFKAEIEGWWKPQENCDDEKLIAIQIARTNQDIKQRLKGFIPKKQIISLSQNDVYAIIYSFNHQTINYNLLNFRDELTIGIVSSLKFDPATAGDTMILGNRTYYLNGKCEGKTNNSCNLWMQNNFDGNVELVSTNIAKTGTGQMNELQNISTLRFSSNQDYEAGVTIVIVNEVDDSFKVVKLSSPNFEIDSQDEYSPTNQGYNDAKIKYTR